MTEILDSLYSALTAHGVGAEKFADHIAIENTDVVLGAEIYEGRVTSTSASVTLEVKARAAQIDGHQIIEGFAGTGVTKEAAIANAFAKFLLGSFHVILEALADHKCDEMQAEVEIWSQDVFNWKLYSGPLISQHSTESILTESYVSFFEKLKALYCDTAAPGPHWIRVFLGAHGGGRLGSEVLLDNEPWEAAHDVLLQHEWHFSDEYQSVRHFMLAIPTITH